MFKSAAESVSLQSKKTLITGSASGIGKAASLRFAEAGSDLVLVDINENGNQKNCRELSAFDVKVQTKTADLSKKESIDRLWESLEGQAPDILVNIMGIYPARDYLEVEKDFYEEVLDTNLHSVFWMCQHFIRRRKGRGGIIVNVSSVEAVTPFKDDMAHYIISKSGVYALTRSLAHDYGRKGFRINGVVPGVVKTPGISRIANDALKKLRLGIVKTGYLYLSRLSLGRLGEADEVAKVILFLSSDLASYVQGVMLPVDGGFLSS